MGLLTLALGVIKPTENNRVTENKPRIGCEHHIGPALGRSCQLNRGPRVNNAVKALPLCLCPLEGRTMDIPFHPGVDDIINGVVLRRTHQNLGSGHRKRTHEGHCLE